MILNLKKIHTRIAVIHNIPKHFFKNINLAPDFGDHLFPSWSMVVFAATDLKAKFKVVYDAYKALPTQNDRDRIVSAFINTNKVEELCFNGPGSTMFTIHDLHATMQAPIDNLFGYLYNTAVNYPGFQNYTKTTISNSVDNFISKHEFEVCPFCGLEGFTNLNGQARLALDHWLCRDLFPFAAVNFNNLIPLGDKCNSRPAKGSKNILINNPEQHQRITAYYPFSNHGGIECNFDFIKQPDMDGINDDDWAFKIFPKISAQQDIYDSWNNTLNIDIRYSDYVKKNVLEMWENDYKRFIEEDHDIEHAETLDDFKGNLKIWRASFPVLKRTGALAYRGFIDYLLTRASDAYLTGLYKMFHSEYRSLQ